MSKIISEECWLLLGMLGVGAFRLAEGLYLCCVCTYVCACVRACCVCVCVCVCVCACMCVCSCMCVLHVCCVCVHLWVCVSCVHVDNFGVRVDTILYCQICFVLNLMYMWSLHHTLSNHFSFPYGLPAVSGVCVVRSCIATLSLSVTIECIVLHFLQQGCWCMTNANIHLLWK